MDIKVEATDPITARADETRKALKILLLLNAMVKGSIEKPFGIISSSLTTLAGSLNEYINIYQNGYAVIKKINSMNKKL